MSLLRKLEKRDYTGGYFTNPYGLQPGQIPTNWQQPNDTASYMTGTGVSSQTAMRHWAVWACIRIIADVVATLPIDVFTKDGTPIDPVPDRILHPSAYATKLQWLWQVIASLGLDGNAYGLVASEDRLGYPTQVDLIAPEKCRLEKDQNTGQKLLKIGNKTLAPDQFWHLPGPQLPGEIAGMSPIKYASTTIMLGLDAERFGSDFFRNGIHPTAVLETDQLVDDDQAAAIKGRIRNVLSRRDMVVLGAGMKLNPWQLNANDAQFIETQRLNAAQIAQIFGVPPEMIGAAPSGKTLTYANREQHAQDFLTNAVNPWLARLEESLSAWFPRGTYIKFNTGALLRSDLITRYMAHQIGIRNGFELPSEARELENFAEIPGLDDKPLPPVGSGGPSTDPMNQGKQQ